MKKKILTFVLAIIMATSMLISGAATTLAGLVWPSFNTNKPIKAYTISTSN